MTERGREVINMLKFKNKVLLVENRILKSNCNDMVSGRDVEKEIAELWLEIQRLKTQKGSKVDVSRKKTMVAYSLLVMSWVVFLGLLVPVKDVII